MDEIFASRPAKFPSNNTEEQNSVYKLLDIIDKNVIKPDPKIIDKFPNTDGEFTITDVEQFPIGKLEVQIKTLPNSDVGRPKYQCELPFLKHCEISLLPVILVVVNAENEIGYWLHISRNFLLDIKSRIKGKSISIDIPTNNIIKRSETLYVEEWTKIVRGYIRRKIDSEAQDYYRIRYEELYKQLNKFPKPVHTIGTENLKKISLFIDKLNNCLDNEFQVLKEVRYHDFWKLSITYTRFEDDAISYAIIPIKYGENDLLIREALDINPFNDIDNASFIRGLSGKNPVKFSPIEHAYEIISEETLEIVEKQNLVLLCEELAIEYATDFFDAHKHILPLQFEEVISVEEYFAIAAKYMPIWVEEYYKHQNISIAGEVLDIDLDSIFWHLFPEDIKAINVAAISRFENKRFSNYTIRDESKNTSLEYLFNSLELLSQSQTDEIHRPYGCKNSNNDTGWTWGNYSPETAFEKVKFVYSSLPIVYDTFIESFFPLLYKELRFYVGCNLLVINLNYKSSYNSIHDSPSLDVFYLKREGGEISDMKFYLNYEGCPIRPEDRLDVYKNGIIIDSVKFEFKTGYFGGLDYLFDEFMLRNTMYDLVQRKLENYFKTKTS